jgi:hypothetical protein
MKLEKDKFKISEALSNPAIAAVCYLACPIGGVCFYVSTGFGKMVKSCEHLKAEEENGECTYEAI